MAKKSKKKFDQSFRKKKDIEKDIQSDAQSIQAVKSDYLDPGMRVGFILMGYLLFIAGSVGCLLLGYAGADKKGSYEVKVIGWMLLLVHSLFIVLMLLNVRTVGLIPIKAVFAILIISPFLYAIVGFAGQNAFWGKTLKTIGITILIPHFVVLAIVDPSILWDEAKSNIIITQSNTEYIAGIFEKYESENDGKLPESPSDSGFTDYIDTVITNPYNNQQVQFIEFGSDNYPGNVTYVPAKIDGSIVGFYLLGYGGKNYSGEDVDGDNQPDHVILVIKKIAGLENMSSQRYSEINRRFPALASIFKKE